jgi:hypothetical protein
MRYCLLFVLALSARADFEFIELIATAPSGQQSTEVSLERWFEVTAPTPIIVYGGGTAARPEYCIDSLDPRSNCYWSTSTRASLETGTGIPLYAAWYQYSGSWFEPTLPDVGGFGGGSRILDPGLYRLSAYTSYTLFPPTHDAIVGPMVGNYAKVGFRVDSQQMSNLNFATTPEPSATLLTVTILGIVGFIARKRLRCI